MRVNAVAPGITGTPMLGKTGDGAGAPAWPDAAMHDVRILTPEDIAGAVIGRVEDDSESGEVLELPNAAR